MFSKVALLFLNLKVNDRRMQLIQVLRRQRDKFMRFIIFFNFHFWLQILEKVKIAYDIPVVTDVHESIQVSFSFLSANTTFPNSCKKILHFLNTFFACENFFYIKFLLISSLMPFSWGWNLVNV